MTSVRRSPADARTTALGVVVALGTTLVILSELTDRLETDLGLGLLNLALSIPLAVLATCIAALCADALRNAVDRRSRRRAGPHTAASALMILGGADMAWVLATHLSRPIRLDAWIALAGGVLLTISAGVE